MKRTWKRAIVAKSIVTVTWPSYPSFLIILIIKHESWKNRLDLFLTVIIVPSPDSDCNFTGLWLAGRHYISATFPLVGKKKKGRKENK